MIRLFGHSLVRYMPSQLGVALLSFLSVPILTRLLSVEEYGLYTLILASITIMVTLMNGLGPAIVRFYPAVAEDEVDVLVRTSWWAQIVIGSALALAAFMVTRMLWAPEAGLQHLVEIGIIVFALQSIFAMGIQVLRARLHGGLFSVFVLVNKVLSLTLGVVLAAYWHLGVAGILWGLVLGIVVLLPFLWRRIFDGISSLGRVSTPLLGELLTYGLAVGMGNIGGWVLNRSDRYLIQLFHGVREVGLYAVAYSISLQSIVVLGVLFRIASGPLLATVWEQQGAEATQRLLCSVTRLYLLVAIPAVLGLSILAEPIMRVLVGPEFSDAYTMVPWVVGGAFFFGLESRYNHVLLLFKRPRLILFCNLGAGLLNVGLNLWLLQVFSYKVAAINTFVGYLTLCLSMAYVSRGYLRWPFPWMTAMRSLGATAGMALGLFAMMHTLALSAITTLCVTIPAGMLIYGMCLWGLGEISAAERQVLGGRSWKWLVLRPVNK
ncbi:MAG: oligosaccharide flippase family protein [Candidatus Tectomicrobia bacterium]|nr:oligosaccharide flippase family protein [Candidatus Tectomicrobia bacterium]